MLKSLSPRTTTWIYIALITVVFAVVFTYIFDPALNLGGDNCEYYMLSTSIAQGEGYVNLGNIDHKHATAFPPGYPLLMAGVRIFTDSIVAQKILNGLFLLASVVLLFLFIRRNKMQQTLALTAAIVVLLNYRVLEFATIMMSEMSYLMFSALIIYLLCLYDGKDEGRPWWKNPCLYLLILCAGYAFQIRTQGFAVVVAVAVWFLSVRKWRQAAVFAGGFFLTTLPWTIRNSMIGTGSSRYLDQIMAVNIWRPEEGYISFGDLISRGFDTLQMLLTKAIPGTVIPYKSVDYGVPATFGEWIYAIIIIALIIYGFRQYRRYFWFFFSYAAAVIGIICLWSAPSENRYIVTLVPVLEVGLVTAVYKLITLGVKVAGSKKVFSPLWLLIPAVLLAAGHLRQLNENAKAGLPPPYKNYFEVARYARERLPEGSVVCSRKPSLFYVYSQGYVCNYLYTQDDAELIRNLVDNKVDYVVLEQLGYSSTPMYLYPAMVNNEDLFAVELHLQNPDTYLMRFNREAAMQKFGRP